MNKRDHPIDEVKCVYTHMIMLTVWMQKKLLQRLLYLDRISITDQFVNNQVFFSFLSRFFSKIFFEDKRFRDAKG